MIAWNLRRGVCGTVATVVVLLAGCGPAKSINPVALRKENEQLKVTLRQSQDQVAQLQVQRDNLDDANETLQMELARGRQASQRAVGDEGRFASRGSPGAAADSDYDDYGDVPKGYGPAQGRAGGSASFAAGPGGSAGGWSSMPNAPGAEVLRDGDTIRIRVTSTSLFDPGKATLKPGAAGVLDRVAATLRRDYPGDLIGIEGHTDSDPIRRSQWKDNHELSVERAKAVYEYLRTRGGLNSEQLYVAGYGANVPVASNKTSSGKAQNRRVEFVIQPSGARASNDTRPRR